MRTPAHPRTPPVPCRTSWVALLALAVLAPLAQAKGVRQDRVRVTFGHRAAAGAAMPVRLLAGPGVEAVSPLSGIDLEPDDTVGQIHVGAGDVDGVEAIVSWREPTAPRRTPHSTWQYLLDHTDADASRRLRHDPAFLPDAAALTVQTGGDGTRGFTVGLAQLVRTRAMWLPGHDAYVTLGDAPPAFAAHVASLQGRRVLDRVRHEPEASYAQYASRWEDVGDPSAWDVPWQTRWLGTTGHLVGLAPEWGALSKFGVDRWGSVRPDLAAKRRFRLDLSWDGRSWAGQRLTHGLPVLVTRLEHAGQACTLEQFAAPLGRPGDGRSGVLVTSLTLTGNPGPFRVGIRFALEPATHGLACRHDGARWVVTDRDSGRIWLAIEPGAATTLRPRDADGGAVALDWEGDLPVGRPVRAVVKLASPPLLARDLAELDALDPGAARADVCRYWEDWLARGARFEVPEPVVNDLFRANLWHALRLPRSRPDGMDLPYSNFAYGQHDADWPVNQAVYVDSMLYGLRGYFDVAEGEFTAMFRSQQRPDGRIGGFADWGVYTPSLLHAIGQNYLLARDRAGFHRLLPNALRALDWCLAEVAKARRDPEAPGLVRAPLNDLTHGERVWAFNQAYFFAGLDTFARALEVDGHHRAAAARAAAEGLRRDVERAFARASVQAPVVALADGTWVNYVPSDALTPRRLLEQWYPSDVDTGPLHLVRLGAVDPRGPLATAMLNDHEDNLFLRQWGAANEPVYNPQGTAYLRRDEPDAAIRTFYSTMACAFSRGQLEPLEHRWAWGQYFGPPSTDGAWFELYRNLLLGDSQEALRVGPATPRAWLADGQTVLVERAPTWHGPVSVRIESAAAVGAIRARVEFLSDRRPATLLVRLRHPSHRRLREVEVNGAAWTDFDPDGEWVRIAGPKAAVHRITAHY